MLLPVHERMAELWTLGRKRPLTDVEQQELDHCLKVNADYAYRMAELENLSMVAYMTEDWDWLHDICAQIEELKAGNLRPKKKKKSVPKRKKKSETDQ